MNRNLNDDLEVAFQLADAADQIVAERFRPEGFPFERKYDGSPVTEIDRAVERVIREKLAVLRPGEAVLGEEEGEALPTLPWGPLIPTAPRPSPSQGRGEHGQGAGAERVRWIVDPIDGTKKFVRGIPIFATLLALELDGEIAVAMVSAPLLEPTGRRWWAMRGLGAYTDGRPIEVSNVSRLQDASVLHGSAEGWVRQGHGPALLDLAAAAWGTFAPGDFWIHLLVAEGKADAAVEPEAWIWDLAPLKLIVEEAGGRFTDFAGVNRPDGRNGISTNGLIHDEVLAIVRRS
jgi:histidinol-phosphatase